MVKALRRGWRMARLGECCDIVSGATPRTDIPDYWNGDIRWATPRDLSALEKPVLHETAKRITQAGYDSCSTSLMPAGAVLFTSRAPVGLVAIAGQPMCTNQGFKSLVPGPDVDRGYLAWFLRCFASTLELRGNGTTFTEVSKAVVSRFEIPLPPLQEQSKLAAILDKADAIRRARHDNVQLLDKLSHATFLSMFGETVKRVDAEDLPLDWQLATVASVAAKSANACAGGPFGSSLGRADYIDGSGVPVIRGTNLIADRGEFRDEGFVFVSEAKAQQLRRNIALPGDIVFTQRGTLGQVARIPIGSRYPRYVISQSQMKVTLNEDFVDPTYFVHYFLSPRGRSDIETRTMTTGVPHINLSILKNLPVVIPPLNLQSRFGEFGVKHALLRKRAKFANDEAERLLGSVVAYAFGNR